MLCMIVLYTVVTFYATLGEDAVAFGLNECGVTHLVTSMELLETKLKVNYSLLSAYTTCTYDFKGISSGCCLDAMMSPFFYISS